MRGVLREVFGLFVDDGWFAATILIWLALAWVLLPRLGLSGALGCLLLFVGLAAILLASAVRRARGSRRAE